MQAEMKTDLAYYDIKSVAGKLRPGMVRAGDIYSLESWQESAAVVTVRGSNLGPPMVAALRERRIEIQLDKMYAIAAPSFIADEKSDKIGRAESYLRGPMIRDVTVAYLRSHGFEA
jgi:hypothetical protein